MLVREEREPSLMNSLTGCIGHCVSSYFRIPTLFSAYGQTILFLRENEVWIFKDLLPFWSSSVFVVKLSKHTFLSEVNFLE